MRKLIGNPAPWTGEGVSLSHGTEVRMDYLGRVYYGRIAEGQWLVRDHKGRTRSADSPSTAATAVARTASGALVKLNGWKHWEARLPGSGIWVPLAALRASATGSKGFHFVRRTSRRTRKTA